jgi:hypothetical protein
MYLTIIRSSTSAKAREDARRYCVDILEAYEEVLLQRPFNKCKRSWFINCLMTIRPMVELGLDASVLLSKADAVFDAQNYSRTPNLIGFDVDSFAELENREWPEVCSKAPQSHALSFGCLLPLLSWTSRA